jgi:hypothetical protein
MQIRTLFPATLGLLVLAGVATAMPPAEVEQRVRGFVESANQHDVDAMLAATETGFRWMQVLGERVEVEVAGHDQLRSWLEGYFRTTPDSRSSLGAISVDGNYASAIETVEYRDRSGEVQRQSATSVYELGSDGLIRSVWYFPARKLPATP